MKNIGKRFLSIVLCLVILASTIVISVVATPSSSECAALIDAWGNLQIEEYVTIAYPGGTKQGSPTLGETSDLTNLSDEQKAKMGSHYWKMNSSSDIVWSIEWENSENLSSYDSIFYVVYGTAGAVCTQINGGSETYTSANSFATVNVTPSSSWWSIQHWSYDWYEPIYIGSVVGHKISTATVPDNVYSWSASKLYREAAKIDLSKCVSGGEEFKTALKAVFEQVYPEAAALIDAWGNLQKQDNIVLAHGTTAISDLDIQLDNSQKALMGTHFTKIASATADNWTGAQIGFTILDAYKNKSLADLNLSKISFYVYAESKVELHLAINFNSGFGNYPSSWNLVDAGFREVDLTASLADVISGSKSLSTITVKRDYSEQAGDLYIGSIMGIAIVNAAIPTGLAAMSEAQIYEQAQALDLTQYTSGVEDFEVAKAALYTKIQSIDPEDYAREELISAWQAISSESKEKIDVIAVPQSTVGADNKSYVAIDVTDSTNVGTYNLNLGTKYIDKLNISIDGTAPAWGRQIWFSGVTQTDFTKYKDVYFYACGYSNDSTTYTYLITQVNGSAETYTYNAVTEWTKVTIDKTLSNASNVKFIVSDGSATHLSFGSLLGKYDYSPELPENYDSMTLTQLVRAAKKIDSEGFGGTEEFNSAVKNAEKFVDTSPQLAEKLIAEWRAMGNAKSDVVAVPASSYTGTDGQIYARKEVTDSVEGLLDSAVLGTYYIDKMAVNTVVQDHQKYFSVIEEFADISEYDTLSLYYAVYDADGNFIPSTAMLQINGGEDKYAATSIGWGSFNHNFTQNASQFISNIKLWIFNANNIAYISFGSVIGHYIERPNIPKDVDSLSFIDLVEAAEECDVSKFDSTAFEVVLKDCQDYIKYRRDTLFGEYDALGIPKPENADTISVSELIDATLELDLTTVANAKSLGVAVWNLVVLTESGASVAELKEAWSLIAELPFNWYFMSAQQWVTEADALDITLATDEQQTNFNIALENVRDILTKGCADVSSLTKLVNDANTMNWYDFTDDSWAAFSEARDEANKVLDNYSQITQKMVDEAEKNLFSTWGLLKMYARDQWFDAMDYFLKVDPELGCSKGSGSSTVLAVLDEKLPNGVQSIIAVEKQDAGWHPWSFTGAKLSSLDKYDFFEVWYKANTEIGNGLNILGLQLMQQGGGKYYTATIAMPKSYNDGNWHRIEIPFDVFVDDKGNLLSNNLNFVTGIVWGVNYGGEGSYFLSNFVVVKTESVTAGIVPEIPEMAIIEREKIEPAPPPENPFTGVDRGDPWGDAERKENANIGDNTNKHEGEIAVAEGKYGSNLTWALKKNGTLVISGNGNMNVIEGDAPWKDYIDRIVQVTVEDGVTSVSDKAFNGLTQLLKVNLSQTVTKIGNYAFYDCSNLKFIVVPDKVTTIGDYAFGYVYSKEDQTVVKIDGFGVYGTENSIADAYAAAYELEFFAIAPDPNKKTEGNDQGDNNDTLSGTIGTITNPNLSYGTETDAEQAVTGECGNNLIWTYYADGTLVISGTGDMTDYEDVAPWIEQGLDIKKAVIEDGVTGIGDSAFYGCSNLSELVISATVTRIGSFAFYECYELKEVKLNATITRVGPYAFGYVYDAEAQDAKLLDGFKLYVSDPSAALTYAKTYEVDYEVYEVTSGNDSKTDNVKDDDGIDWWIWLLIALGGAVIIVGVIIAVIVIVKKSKKVEVLK